MLLFIIIRIFLHYVCELQVTIFWFSRRTSTAWSPACTVTSSLNPGALKTSSVCLIGSFHCWIDRFPHRFYHQPWRQRKPKRCIIFTQSSCIFLAEPVESSNYKLSNIYRAWSLSTIHRPFYTYLPIYLWTSAQCRGSCRCLLRASADSISLWLMGINACVE